LSCVQEMWAHPQTQWGKSHDAVDDDNNNDDDGSILCYLILLKQQFSVVFNNVIYLSLRLLLCFVCKLLWQIIIVVKIDKN
jgi:hypothetical protein